MIITFGSFGFVTFGFCFGTREYPWDVAVLNWKTIYEFDPSKESLLENNLKQSDK